MSTDAGGYAFICLLRDRDDAIGLSRLLEDVRLPEAQAMASFLVPPVAGLDFFADEGSQARLDEWWGKHVAPADLPVYLIDHEDGLPDWMQGVDGLLYVGVPTPAVAAQYGSGSRVVTFRSTSPLDFATVVMRDFSRARGNDPDPRRAAALLFDEGEALRMAALSADFPMNMEDGGFGAPAPQPGYGRAGGYGQPQQPYGQPAPAAPAYPQPFPSGQRPDPGQADVAAAYGSPQQPGRDGGYGGDRGDGHPYPDPGGFPGGQVPAYPDPRGFPGAQPGFPQQGHDPSDPFATPWGGDPAQTAAGYDQGQGQYAPFPQAQPPAPRPRPADPSSIASAHPFDLLAAAGDAPAPGSAPAAPAPEPQWGRAPGGAPWDAQPQAPQQQWDPQQGAAQQWPQQQQGGGPPWQPQQGGGQPWDAPQQGGQPPWEAPPAAPQWGAEPAPPAAWNAGAQPGAAPPGWPQQPAQPQPPGHPGNGGWPDPSSLPSLFEDPRLDPGQRQQLPALPPPQPAPAPQGRKSKGGGGRFQLPISLGWNKRSLKREFQETPIRDFARILAERGPSIVVMGSRKGGVGKTSYAAGVAIVAGTVLDTVGHKAAIVDANIANPDAWGHLNLREGAATVREVVAALTNNREPPPPVHATTPALACYPESRETTEYSKTDIRRFAEYLRRRYTFIVVDMSNRLPDPLAGPEAAAAAYWLEQADVLVLPTTSSKLDFVGVLDYLDVRDLPPTVVPYIVPSVRKNREHPVTQQYLQAIRERVHHIVEIPDEADSVRYAGMEGVPVEQVSPALRAAYRELTEVIARVPPRVRR